MLPAELYEIVARLDDEQLREVTDLVLHTEPQRRSKQAAMADTITELRESGELEAPEAATIEPDKELSVDTVPAWVNPGTLHSKMYTLGNVVTHNGRVWKSTHPGLNHWEPGSTGVDYRIWADITDEVTEEPEDSDTTVPTNGAKPFKPGLELKAGDVVTYNGNDYKVLQPHTSAAHWPPDAAHSLFSRL